MQQSTTATRLNRSNLEAVVQQRIARWEPIVDQIYNEMNVPAELRQILKAQIHQESRWNPSASSGEAHGLTQFTPDTAKDYGVRFGSSEAAVRSQIRGQVKYMTRLIERYNGNIVHALQAYNWGPGHMNQHLRGRRSLPKETREYVPKIQKWTGYYR